MSFEKRHEARTSRLGVLVTFFRALAIAYLSLHAAVAWFAYQATGLVEALLTFVLLGFGDLYWAVRWWPGEDVGQTVLALAAALICFTSWLTRPLFNRWINSFTADMLKDMTSEIERTIEGRKEEPGADAGHDAADVNNRPKS